MAPRPCPPRLGLWPGRTALARRPDPRAVPGHPSRPGLWQLSRSHRDSQAAQSAGGHPRAGLSLTESNSLLPAASVCGWYFAHPEARYFSVDRITADQVEDYARRKHLTIEEVERWLSPNLGYDPADFATG